MPLECVTGAEDNPKREVSKLFLEHHQIKVKSPNMTILRKHPLGSVSYSSYSQAWHDRVHLSFHNQAKVGNDLKIMGMLVSQRSTLSCKNQSTSLILGQEQRN